MRFPQSKRVRAVIAVVVVVVLAGGVASGFVLGKGDALPANAVFRYGGQTITKTAFDRRIAVLSALYGVQVPTDAAKVDTFNRDAAKSMAVAMILRSAIAKQGIVISDKQARDELDKLIAQELAGGQSAFTTFLASKGISQADVIDELKVQLATARLSQKITASAAPITTAMAQQTYDSHRAQMVTPEERHLVNIVVASKEVAQAVLAKAVGGQAFSTLAATYSQDASTKAKGGDLGTLSASDLDSAYATAAFAVKKGAFFGPVQTQYGWNVGQVIGIVASSPVSFAKMESSLKAALLDKEKLALWNTYLGGLLKSADVQYAAAYRPANPTALPSNAATTAHTGAGR